jgi:hypothetical protein
VIQSVLGSSLLVFHINLDEIFLRCALKSFSWACDIYASCGVTVCLWHIRQWHFSSHILEGHLMKMQSGTILFSSMSFLMV